MRFRLIAALGIAAALLSMTACRNSPKAAAYVGDTEITEARITQLQDGYNKGKAADALVPRNVVVAYAVNDELCNRLRQQKGFTVDTPAVPNESPEFVTVANRAKACINAIPSDGFTASEADYHALYQRAVAAGLDPVQNPYEPTRDQWQANPDVNKLLGQEQALDKVAPVSLNPRYGRLPLLVLNASIALPLGGVKDEVVTDRPATATPAPQ